MSQMNNKGEWARRQVSEGLRAYHEVVIRIVEPNTEAFFDRVMPRARKEGSLDIGAQAQGEAQL